MNIDWAKAQPPSVVEYGARAPECEDGPGPTGLLAARVHS
jgi:hypothetical protein